VGSRFGEIAVSEGYVSRAAVQDCLKIQEKLRNYGLEPKRIGEIMVEKGHLSDADVEAVLVLQGENGESTGTPPSAPSVKFPMPKVLGGFEILELLGKGGMGAVYKARQKSLDRLVAIKVLSPQAAKNRSFIRRFKTEARIVARLGHPNIIAGIDVGEEDGIHYFAMEFVEGETLDETLAREGLFSEQKALGVMVQMALALEHAEKHELVHRDVKPQNIMVDRQGQAKLCDLGLAKTASGDEQTQTSQEGGAAPLGTPHYLSPEQARGEPDLDVRSDIYSLGATFYHIVTGRPPFEGQSPMVLMTKHLTETPEDPRTLNEDLSKGCSELILGMLGKEREDRPQSARELLEDLERVQDGKRPKCAKASKRKGSASLERKRGTSKRRPTDNDERDRGRRRRSAQSRDARKQDSLMLGLALVAVLGLVGVFVWSVFVNPTQFEAPPKVTEEQQSEASAALFEARGYERDHRRDDPAGVTERYRKIVESYRGTKAARLAESLLRERK